MQRKSFSTAAAEKRATQKGEGGRGKKEGRGAAANANARVKVFIKCIKRAKVVTTYCVSVVVCTGVCVLVCVLLCVCIGRHKSKCFYAPEATLAAPTLAASGVNCFSPVTATFSAQRLSSTPSPCVRV